MPAPLKRAGSSARKLRLSAGDYEQMIEELSVPAEYKGPSFEKRCSATLALSLSRNAEEFVRTRHD